MTLFVNDSLRSNTAALSRTGDLLIASPAHNLYVTESHNILAAPLKSDKTSLVFPTRSSGDEFSVSSLLAAAAADVHGGS